MAGEEDMQLLHNKPRDFPLEQSAIPVSSLRALDCIPLAISDTAAYINQRTRMTVVAYQDNPWKRHKQESLLNWNDGQMRRVTSASNSVMTTWQTSFEQIQQEQQVSAVKLLSLVRVSL